MGLKIRSSTSHGQAARTAQRHSPICDSSTRRLVTMSWTRYQESASESWPPSASEERVTPFSRYPLQDAWQIWRFSESTLFGNLYGRCFGLFWVPANPRMASTTPWLTPTSSLDLHTFHWCCGSFWPPKERRSTCGAVWCSSGSLYSASAEVSAWLLTSQTLITLFFLDYWDHKMKIFSL